MSHSHTVLVTGATGIQGGAVVQALLKAGHTGRALTRNSQSAPALQLAAQGVEVVQGNFDDAHSLALALNGMDTCYIMGSPFEGGVEQETQQGIALANAAKAANVGHLIYGSVANADQNTGIPHFDSKYKVEQHIKNLGIPYTISAPVFFMSNILAPWAVGPLKAGNIIQAMPADQALQQISTKDIGEFVASLVSRREAVFYKRFDIAGDELNGDEMASTISKSTQHSITYQGFPTSELRMQSEDLAIMFEWFTHTGYSVDLAGLKKAFSDVNWQDYGQWVESQDWKILEA